MPEEQALIGERMAEVGISNMGAYMRKMTLNGYMLHVDLSDIRELVPLQRRCANSLNQVAIHVNIYGGIYPDEIKAQQWDYADLLGSGFVLLSDYHIVFNYIRQVQTFNKNLHIQFETSLTQSNFYEKIDKKSHLEITQTY